MISLLSAGLIDRILERLPSLTIAVIGDLFLDRYLDLDGALTEPSLETGLDAYQVVRVRSLPGALGTVLNNLVALGVGRVVPVAVIGDDGEGYELRQALRRQAVVDSSCLIGAADRRTPTYTKPMLCDPGKTPRELNRLDIKNREKLTPGIENRLAVHLNELAAEVHGAVVLDQVSEVDCGVVTKQLRHHLADLGERRPDLPILADSRERIGLFRNVMLKPNRRECLRAINWADTDAAAVETAIHELTKRTGRTVFCTAGEEGVWIAEPRKPELERVPAVPVTGPIDIVGAGDSTSAGIICALACGASNAQAAAFGNIVASITIRQIGTTGTATPEQVRQRWSEIDERRGLSPPNRRDKPGGS